MKAIDIIKDLSMFIILVLLQALVLNSITLFGVAVPILYIYFIIKQPLGRNRFYVILSAFLIFGQVLIPGVVGPFIGALVLRGSKTITNSDGTTSFIPGRIIFMAALIVAVKIGRASCRERV